jgi:hypothetical protein
MHRLRRRPASRPCFAAASAAVFFSRFGFGFLIYIVYSVSVGTIKSGTPDPIRYRKIAVNPRFPPANGRARNLPSLWGHPHDVFTPQTRKRGDK